MPLLLMTPVITAAMSKLIKVVGSLSYFHVEARVAQRRFPVIVVAETFSGLQRCLARVLEAKMTRDLIPYINKFRDRDLLK